MRRPTLTAPSEILEELAGEVLAPMDRGAPVSFSDALDSMIAFHAFLLRAHTRVDKQGPTDSYAFIHEGAFSSLHKNWERQYYRIFERAGELLGRQPDFFRRAARISNLLIDQTATTVPSQILDSLLELILILFHRGGDWWLRRVTEETGKRPTVHEPTSLSGYEADIYEETMRSLIGGWEHSQNFPKEIWKWEPKSLPPDERWERLRASMSFIRQHLRCSAYMVAAAVWRGDEFTASAMSDSLIKWPGHFEHEFFRHDIWAETALLNSDLSKHTWENALTKLQFERDPSDDHEPTPEAVFRAIIKNLWTDVTLTLAAIIAAWGFQRGNRTSLPARASRKLLFAKTADPEANLRRSYPVPGVSATQVLTALIRQYTSGGSFEDSSYRDWLNGLVRMFDGMTEREVVSGRAFTPSTKHGLEDLQSSHLAILMSLADPDKSVDRPPDLEEAIISISQLPSSDEPARNLKGELGEFQGALEEMSEAEWLTILNGLCKSDVKIDNFDERKININGLLTTALKIVEKERAERIKKLEVQQERLDELAGAISNNVFAQDTRTFPLCKFRIDKGKTTLVENRILIRSNYDKGCLTEPRMANPASNEQEAYSKGIAEIINALLLREVMSANSVDDIIVTDPAQYWESVKKKGAELADQDLEPLFLVEREVEPTWVTRWIWDQGLKADIPKPEDLSVSRDRSESESTNGYLATFNDIKVQIAPVQEGVSLVLPREIFQRLEIRTLENGHRINIQFNQKDDPWTGDLAFSWAHRIQGSPYRILRLIYGDPDDLD